MPILTRVLILLFLLAFSFSISVQAKDSTLITSGVARQLSLSDMSFNLAGQGFQAKASVGGSLRTARDVPKNWDTFFPPGSVMYAHNIYDDFFGTNTAIYDGVIHYPVYYGGGWEIMFGPVLIPNVQARVITVAVPFTMTGELDGYSKSYQSATTADLIFGTDLQGQGIATMELTGYMGYNGWQYSLLSNSVVYNFQPAPNLPETIRLSAPTYTVNENDPTGVVSITVIRTGDASSASTVDYQTKDPSEYTRCEQPSDGLASGRCDYAQSIGTLRFAPGETSKQIQIPLIDDAYVETGESFSISLLNAKGDNLGVNSIATVTILDNDTQAPTQNPIDDQAFFIRQQYVDFLGRTPDPAGFNFWMNRMSNCPQGQLCDRTDTSLRFFQSDEFQRRGFFVYRLWDALLGLLPDYETFVTEAARLNGYQTVEEQRQAKDAYLLDFINNHYFKLLYSKYLEPDGMKAKDAEGFVNALCQQAGITPASKQALINNLQSGLRDPAHTLEDFINTPEISGVGTRYYDRGFITMQYFGYLRRAPEQAGFNFWVGQLIGANAPHAQDYRFMVGGFLQSDEYRYRFAPISNR